MKYLLSQLLIFIVGVIVLFYLSRLPGFVPFIDSGEIDWSRVGLVFLFIFLILESFLSMMIFLVEKFIAYGRKEFPTGRFSLKWGIGISFSLLLIIFLHINHLITLPWAIVLFLVLVVIIFIM